MAGIISVTISRQQERELEKLLADVKNGVPRAMSAAINKTIDKTATRIRKRVAAGLKMPLKVVRPLIKPIKTSPNARPMAGKIRLLNFNIALAKAKAKRPPAGGSYALSKVGDPKPLPHPSFRAKLASGHEGFFVRQGAKVKPSKGKYAGRFIRRGRRKGQPILRQKIYELHAPSPRQFFETAPGVAKEELAAIGPELEKQLASQVDRFLKAPAK